MSFTGRPLTSIEARPPAPAPPPCAAPAPGPNGPTEARPAIDVIEPGCDWYSGRSTTRAAICKPSTPRRWMAWARKRPAACRRKRSCCWPASAPRPPRHGRDGCGRPARRRAGRRAQQRPAAAPAGGPDGSRSTGRPGADGHAVDGIQRGTLAVGQVGLRFVRRTASTKQRRRSARLFRRGGGCWSAPPPGPAAKP